MTPPKKERMKRTTPKRQGKKKPKKKGKSKKKLPSQKQG
ncbi:hypothetical protein BTHERMOSOX_860 [Bathymodiolus thermophilus thioautotrophic gill symbiont]|nr:hypothetical protein BTHERMOSOX_860 [Bathymodiolus thermophilus thioautotrophic gill symbiont]